MTYEQIHRMVLVAAEFDDLLCFISEAEEDAPDEYFTPTGEIKECAFRVTYDVAHGRGFDFIRAYTDLTQKAYADHYGIPQRTIEAWDEGQREPSSYLLRFLLADAITDF